VGAGVPARGVHPVATGLMATRTVRANQAKPLALVARSVVRRRLRAVGRAAAAAVAVKASGAAVHRLRVATRRATAAITVFRPLIPRRQRRWLKKALRCVRRAAGEARDLDVLVARDRAATSTVRAGDSPRRLAQVLAQRRPETKHRLQVGLAGVPMHAWRDQTDATTAAIESRTPAGTVASFASRRARRLVRRFMARLDRRLCDGRAIHRLRIESKKLRYALEVIGEIGTPVVTSTSDRVLRHLQARLGDYTDPAAAADRLGRWSRREPDGPARRTLLAARKREATAAKRARRACKRWWTSKRRAGVARKLERTLGGIPG